MGPLQVILTANILLLLWQRGNTGRALAGCQSWLMDGLQVGSFPTSLQFLWDHVMVTSLFSNETFAPGLCTGHLHPGVQPALGLLCPAGPWCLHAPASSLYWGSSARFEGLLCGKKPWSLVHFPREDAHGSQGPPCTRVCPPLKVSALY